jgi:sensor histidine kinase YesM
MSRSRKWAIGFAVWSAINLYFVGRNLLIQWVNAQPVNWHETMWIAFAWYIWALMTPAAMWMAKRFPLEKPALWKKFVLHIFASVFFWFYMCLVFSFAWYLSQDEKTYGQLLWEGIRTYGFVLDLIVYWTIVTISHAVKYYRNHREARITATQLEAKLLQSQIQALHMQLHPHFLFNTLHSISELVHEDVNASRQMLDRLGQFLRLTLENSGSQQVPLEKELEFLECYLEIQQVRFQDRLRVKMAIDEKTRRLLVPNLVLQPIVENAIRYGIAPRPECGTVEIKAERNNGTLQLQVRDDGPGLPLNNHLEEGLGLSNTRARLRQLYGKFHQFDLRNAPDGGLLVTLEIPARMENTAQ